MNVKRMIKEEVNSFLTANKVNRNDMSKKKKFYNFMNIRKIIKEETQKVLCEVWNTRVPYDCYNSIKKLIEKYGISNVIYSGAKFLEEEIGDKTAAKKIYDIPLN